MTVAPKLRAVIAALARWRIVGILLLALVLLSGCASSKVTQSQTDADREQIPRPDRIIVYPFAATPEDVAATALTTGQFLTVDESSLAGRVLIGFSAGAGELRTHVQGSSSIQAASARWDRARSRRKAGRRLA